MSKKSDWLISVISYSWMMMPKQSDIFTSECGHSTYLLNTYVMFQLSMNLSIKFVYMCLLHTFFNKQPVNKQLGLNDQIVKQRSGLGCADLSNHKKLKYFYAFYSFLLQINVFSIANIHVFFHKNKLYKNN